MLKLIKIFICSLMLVAVSIPAQDDNNEIWIDVRSPSEYQQQHLDGAINIPFMQISQRIAEITTDKQQTIHLYCAAGVRAQVAKMALERKGYENVINEGGLKDVLSTVEP